MIFKAKVVVLISLFSLIVISQIGCGGTKIQSSPSAKPAEAATAPGGDQGTASAPDQNDSTQAQPTRRTRHAKHVGAKSQNIPLESSQLTVLVQPQSTEVFDLQGVNVKFKPATPPELTAVAIIDYSELTDDGSLREIPLSDRFVHEHGYPSAALESTVCATGRFSDGRACYVVFADGHVAQASGVDHRLLAPLAASYEEKYKAEQEEKNTKPHKKRKYLLF